MTNFNWFDVTLILIVLISTVFAAFRGLIKASLSLAAWVGSGMTVLLLYPYAYQYLSTRMSSEKLAIVAASIGVFLVVFIIFAIINSRIIHLLRNYSGGVADRFLGFCFGALRGILIACIIFVSINITSQMLHLGKDPDKPGPQWFISAWTYEAMDIVTSGILEFAPTDIPDKLENTVSRFRNVTLSAIGEEFESSPTAARTLSAQERQVMKQVIAALPQESLAEIYKKYDGNMSTISEFERIEIFREILLVYENHVKEGKIAEDKIVPEEGIKGLSDTLNAARVGTQGDSVDENTDTGYKNRNIKQLERLIDGVQ